MILPKTINSKTTKSQPAKQDQANLQSRWFKLLNASISSELSFDADFLYCGASYLR